MSEKIIDSMASASGRYRKEDDETLNIADILDASMGLKRKFQNGAGTITADEGYVFFAVMGLEDSVVTLEDQADVPILAGMTLPGGEDESVEVVSGWVVAFQRRV